jgi:hypothetical protein
LLCTKFVPFSTQLTLSSRLRPKLPTCERNGSGNGNGSGVKTGTELVKTTKTLGSDLLQFFCSLPRNYAGFVVAYRHKTPQNTTQEAYATHAKPGTRTKKHDKTGSEDNAKHDTRIEQRQIFVRALLTENYRQTKEHCWEVQQTGQIETTRRAQGQGITQGTKSQALSTGGEANKKHQTPTHRHKHTNHNHLTTKEKHSTKNTKQHHGLRRRTPRGR